MNTTSQAISPDSGGDFSNMDLVVFFLAICLVCILFMYCVYLKQSKETPGNAIHPAYGLNAIGGEKPHDGLSFGESYVDDKRSPDYQFEGEAIFSSGEEVMVQVGQEWERGFILKRRDNLYEIELMKSGKRLVNKQDVKKVKKSYFEDDSDDWIHLMEGDQVHFQPGEQVLCHFEGEWINGVVNSHLRNTYNILLRDGTLKLFNVTDIQAYVPIVDQSSKSVEPEPGSNVDLMNELELCPEFQADEPGAPSDAVRPKIIAKPSYGYRSDLEESDSEGLEDWEDKMRRLRKYSENVVE